jgi:hypothetical protein
MLGFLTNVRDMKAPLSCGMIILFSLWVTFGNALSKVPADDSLAGNLRRLAEYLGPTGTLAAVSFAAYIVGVVIASYASLYVIKPYLGTIDHRMAHSTKQRFRAFLDRTVGEVGRSVQLSDVITGMNLRGPSIDGAFKIKDKNHQDQVLKDQIVNHLQTDVLSDLDILAVQLHSVKEKSWEKYDKASSEAEFRSAWLSP